ncbi:MAG: AI-2E family transporter [Thermodesulfobacteriota bacterium]
MSEQHRPDMILWFFLVLFVISIFLLGWLIWPFISIIVLGAVFTGVFRPVYTFFTRAMRPSFASMVTCLLIFLVVFIPIVLFVGILSKEAFDLYRMARDAVLSEEIKTLFEKSRVLDRINLVLNHFGITLSGDELNSVISDIAKTVGFYLYEQASAIASNALRFLFDFFLMLLVIYFLLIDGGEILSFIENLSPLPAEQDTKLFQKFKEMAGTILLVNGFAGMIQGIFGGSVFAFFGLKSPVLWGLIMAILAFLPIVGIGVVFIPAAIYLFLSGRIGAGIFFIVSYVVVSGIVEYYLKPKFVGRRVQIHVLLVFLSILGGLKLFGILGIIYGPLIATAFLTLTDIYHASYQKLVEPER